MSDIDYKKSDIDYKKSDIDYKLISKVSRFAVSGFEITEVYSLLV